MCDVAHLIPEDAESSGLRPLGFRHTIRQIPPAYVTSDMTAYVTSDMYISLVVLVLMRINFNNHNSGCKILVAWLIFYGLNCDY